MLEKSEREIDNDYLTISGSLENDSVNTLVNFDVELLQDLLGKTTVIYFLLNIY